MDRSGNGSDLNKSAPVRSGRVARSLGPIVGRGGRVGRAQVSKSRGPGFNPIDAVSNLGQVRLPHVAIV